MEVVDFRSRVLAFRGAGGEPSLRFAHLGVSPVPHQGSILAPASTSQCYRGELPSRMPARSFSCGRHAPFRYNQLVNEEKKIIQNNNLLEKNLKKNKLIRNELLEESNLKQGRVEYDDYFKAGYAA
ncbi:hypothetical protein [Fictibacillus arsenicus]|uniref:Uncharacterized protein n=1 Tax=Fictibacillus arsenicus TaxID=255247 RepID=A0A1V3GD09_9BACL|nr:hypothetical protein [Fictibacillus arsenicus]OOE14735.1 hypothetical protein UN64_05985 [Fictibacillus arsenicus]